MNAKTATRRRLADLMRKRGWHYKTPPDGLRHRIYCLTYRRHPWYDWGHRLMILTGTDEGGNWSEPRPSWWWYHQGPKRHMMRTRYPRPTWQIITDYDEFRRLTEGLNEDQLYEWQAIGVDQDGELTLGHRYWGGTFYGMTKAETPILRRYLRKWRRLDWFGLRPWLYSQGLHAAVHLRKPWTCQQVPPRGSGGYDHWHCTQPRHHNGLHRFNNYTWGHEVGGELIGIVMHEPTS